MWSSSTLFLGATSLFSLASAFPHELAGRQSCAAGTVFYVCNINNFRGCCSIDPCAIKAGCPDAPYAPAPVSPSPPKTSPSSPPAAPPVSSSPVAAPAGPTCKPGTKGFQQFNPLLRTIGAANSDPSLFKITNITALKTDVSQVFTFSNIPASAKNIELKWFISPTVPQFSTKDSATGAVVLLDSTKLPKASAGTVLTAEAVTAAIDRSELNFPNGAVGGAGFGFWDLPEFVKPHDHQISTLKLPSRTELSFRIGIKDAGEVVIRQTQQDGLYISYDC